MAAEPACPREFSEPRPGWKTWGILMGKRNFVRMAQKSVPSAGRVLSQSPSPGSDGAAWSGTSPRESWNQLADPSVSHGGLAAIQP